MLGIIDWGIGGVGIYKLIKERLGDVPIVYFSDTGVTPYGKMSRPELTSRLNLVIRFLRSKGVTHLVIGCNAASTAIAHLDPQGIKLTGMIESGVAAAIKQKPTRLGLIGGRRTVLSGVYKRAFAAHGIRIEQRIAQPLSALIESGDTGSQSLRTECRRILAPIRNCSHILLACTHYPAVADVIKDVVASQTRLIDPASELTDRILRGGHARVRKSVFLTTGDTDQMRSAATNAFKVDIGNPIRVPVGLG